VFQIRNVLVKLSTLFPNHQLFSIFKELRLIKLFTVVPKRIVTVVDLSI